MFNLGKLEREMAVCILIQSVYFDSKFEPRLEFDVFILYYFRERVGSFQS